MLTVQLEKRDIRALKQMIEDARKQLLWGVSTAENRELDRVYARLANPVGTGH